MNRTQPTELKKIITRQGLRQERLAQVAGIDPALICKIAKRQRKATRAQKDDIVWALNQLAAGGPYSVENVFPPSENPVAAQEKA